MAEVVMTRNLDFIAHVREDEVGRDAKSQTLAQSRLVSVISWRLLTWVLRSFLRGVPSLSSVALFTFIHPYFGFHFLCDTLLRFWFSLHFLILRTYNVQLFSISNNLSCCFNVAYSSISKSVPPHATTFWFLNSLWTVPYFNFLFVFNCTASLLVENVFEIFVVSEKLLKLFFNISLDFFCSILRITCWL